MASVSSVLGRLGPTLVQYGTPNFLVDAAAMIADRAQAKGQVETRQKVAMDQLLTQQKLQEDQQAQSIALQKEQIQAEADANAAARRDALRRAIARQKTLFSAQGISPSDSGSSDAVLQGLSDTSQADQAFQDQLTTLKETGLDQNLSQTKQKNLLEAAQLGQQQSLYRALNGY
jgi:hypothetical protein